MPNTSQRDWLLVALGILMIICGFVVAFMPLATLVSITLFAGIAFLVTGVVDIIDYFRFRTLFNVPGWALLYAVLDIVVGILLILHPVVLSELLPWLVGIGVILFGVFEIFGSLQVRRLPGSAPWGWMLVSGVLGVLCGIAFIVSPTLLAFVIAWFVVLRGITLAVFGFAAKTGLR